VVKQEILIFGAGGHAKVVIDCCLSQGITVIKIFDDNPAKTGKPLLTYGVGGLRQDLIAYLKTAPLSQCIVAIGDNIQRRKIFSELKASGCVFGQAMHQSALLAPSVSLGEGLMVMPRAVINADTEIADNVIINTGALIEHDCKVGPHSHIGPNATLCGGVAVGEATLVGAGAVILPNLVIGKDVIIGAGAVVLRDVPDHAKLVGNPARLV
jgi:sugar O-acyltransferase (sialic acid O-acetyltransferase NeuD family)